MEGKEVGEMNLNQENQHLCQGLATQLIRHIPTLEILGDKIVELFSLPQWLDPERGELPWLRRTHLNSAHAANKTTYSRGFRPGEVD